MIKRLPSQKLPRVLSGWYFSLLTHTVRLAYICTYWQTRTHTCNLFPFHSLIQSCKLKSIVKSKFCIGQKALERRQDIWSNDQPVVHSTEPHQQVGFVLLFLHQECLSLIYSPMARKMTCGRVQHLSKIEICTCNWNFPPSLPLAMLDSGESQSYVCRSQVSIRPMEN